VLAQVIEELIESPPTADELRLLTEVAQDAQEQNLEPEQIAARLQDTRLWHLIGVLAQNDVRILNYIMVLLMIYEIFFKPQPTPPPPPPPPAPQVTVQVAVPTDEIVKEIEKRLEQEHCAPEPSPEGHVKKN